MPTIRSVAVPFAFAFALTTVIEPTASAKGPYVVLRDDGSLNGTITKGPGEILGSIMTQYDQTGLRARNQEHGTRNQEPGMGESVDLPVRSDPAHSQAKTEGSSGRAHRRNV